MNLVTTYLAGRTERLVLLAMIGAIAIGTPILAAVKPDVGSFALVGGPLASLCVTLLMHRRWSVFVPVEEALPPRFLDLPLDLRKEALDLQWGNEIQTYAKPIFAVGPPWIVLILTIGIAIAASWQFPPLLRPVADNDVTMNAFWLVVVWLAAPLAAWGLGWVYVAGEFHQFKESMELHVASHRAATLRSLAREWVLSSLSTWEAVATTEAIHRATDRFSITGADSFPLFASVDRSEDPTRLQPIIVLLAGGFFGVRNGFVWDVMSTSYSVGVEDGGIVGKEDSPTERELYYPDIVTVDYMRDQQKADRGIFKVSLTDGQALSFDTLETGAAAAVEAVRRRTRLSKAQPAIGGSQTSS